MASPDIASWRLQQQRYSLVGEVCPHCEKKIFPPRDICPNCTQEAKTPYNFSGKGEVYSYTTVYDPPEGYKAPFVVALIKLEEGPLVTAQITDDPDHTAQIGTPVEMVTRKLTEDGPRGQLVYGYKFRPVL